MRISLRIFSLSLSTRGTSVREDTLSNSPEATTGRARAGQHLMFAHRCGANFVKNIRQLRPIEEVRCWGLHSVDTIVSDKCH